MARRVVGDLPRPPPWLSVGRIRFSAVPAPRTRGERSAGDRLLRGGGPEGTEVGGGLVLVFLPRTVLIGEREMPGPQRLHALCRWSSIEIIPPALIEAGVGGTVDVSGGSRKKHR
jgi:hypothetical protein